MSHQHITCLTLLDLSAAFDTIDHAMRDLRRIRNTACTIATSLIHSKIDYCNSRLINLPATQTNRLQLIFNSLLVMSKKIPNFHHITPI